MIRERANRFVTLIRRNISTRSTDRSSRSISISILPRSGSLMSRLLNCCELSSIASVVNEDLACSLKRARTIAA